MSRLVVVSNRCTVPRQGSAPGGLAVALNAALRQQGGVWFGWDGSVAESTRRVPQQDEVDGIHYATVPLARRDYDEYYKGYANRVLWPLFHYRIDAMQFSNAFREGYRRTNAYLARKLLQVLESGDTVWVHDYHLVPLGQELRAAGIKGRMGFFLHIPFPPYDVLRALPGHVHLLWSFAAYDLIGFQTVNDRDNFLDCVRRGTGAEVGEDGRIRWGRDSSRAAAFPISLDPADVQEMARSARDGRTVRRLEQSLHGRPLVIGIDRLDYSKGLPERFLAYEHLLDSYPETVGNVVYLQVAQPSREDVPEYNTLRLRLEALVGEINGRYAEFDWVPLRYLNKSYARPTVMKFLALARVGLVTPLRDGMNLVAKEYIAAQNPDDPGVLVLSELTGAAHELGSQLLVNPHDRDAVADAILTALRMPLDERKRRWREALDVIERNDIFHWADCFLSALDATSGR
ncbi:MAG: trehalose-6-phosphate synthase [Gammaproteobacteria bacterium]|nr:trehalose-6-phosphate synthase [Gammaproteobacteria bacterium]MCP5200155.1 trehalose-6-phosphate synthase [Gammaproteobacteria bacterium]